MKTYRLRQAPQHTLPYSPLLSALLEARGITTEAEAQKFLSPQYTDTHDPFLLKDMERVVARIVRAIAEKEIIAIYSDYDADGIPGAVVFSDFFKRIGYEHIVHYIPLRNEEGFGLNHDAIDELKKLGVTLLVTIDCGIADIDEVTTAHDKGIDVIITDHHLPLETLPPAYAIVNPKQPDCTYPEKMLCGSGVIFKVVQALIRRGVGSFPEGQEKWMLDMVGLATLSDMVPLLGENRILAHFGMTVLRKSPRVGLRKLLSLLKIDQRFLSEDDISFMITPRINAASRMGIPRDAFDLLSTSDESVADTLARHLDNKNDERKGIVGSMTREIKKRLRERTLREVIVIGDPEWKPSLLGLVAGSLAEEYSRPVFMWGREGTNGDSVIKGSCRGFGPLSVSHLMERAKDHFISFGGHHGAGGFVVSSEHIHTLEDALCEALALLPQEETVEPTYLDVCATLSSVNWETWKDVAALGPFGLDNPKPLFLFPCVSVVSSRQFGKEKNHLELKVSDGSTSKEVTAISFFQTPESFSVPLSPGVPIDLIATLEKSNFRNFPELRLRIVDIVPGGTVGE